MCVCVCVLCGLSGCVVYLAWILDQWSTTNNMQMLCMCECVCVLRLLVTNVNRENARKDFNSSLKADFGSVSINLVSFMNVSVCDNYR